MSSPLSGLILHNGSQIAVIGAGPAGVFFADFAADLAQKRGMDLSIVLLDGKDFTQKGPSGCNLCAGVISETLVDRMNARGIDLPDETVQRHIEGYFLQGKAGGFLVRHPQEHKRITTVFRGNGPRFSGRGDNVSFDDHLLQRLRGRGLRVISEPVKQVVLPADPRDGVTVVYGVGRDEHRLEVDLLVGAFGLNTNMIERTKALGFGYQPPRTVRARCMEVPLAQETIRRCFSNNVFICNWRSNAGKRLASIIPKKDYVTVSLIGRRDVSAAELPLFMADLVRQGRLPAGWTWTERACRCAPKIGVTPAKRPFADRVVIIGDACCSRHYKNGIESAFVTARAAAETAVNRGVSARAFRKHYFRRVRAMARDNIYGKLLLMFNSLVQGSWFLSAVLVRLVQDEKDAAGRMTDILWNLYTGNKDYRTIMRKFLSPLLQWELTTATLELLHDIARKKVSRLFRRGIRKRQLDQSSH